MLNLSTREILLLRILLILVIITAVYYIIIIPVKTLRDNINAQYNTNIEKLTQLDSIYSEYNEVRQTKNRYDQLLKRSGGITSMIEEKSRENNISQNIAHTRENPGAAHGDYQIRTTEVKLESVDIGSALTFIYEIENANRLLRITYLRIHEALRGGDTYDVIMRIDTMSAR